MEKEEFEMWRKIEVDYLFMQMFFYKRKVDEDMSVEQISQLRKDGILTKELLTKIFMDRINEEFE